MLSDPDKLMVITNRAMAALRRDPTNAKKRERADLAIRRAHNASASAFMSLAERRADERPN